MLRGGTAAILDRVEASRRAQILTVKKLIALSPEMAQAISEFRFREQIKAESKAIRRLIERGLEVETSKPAAPK